MRAAIIRQFGGPSGLKIEEVPTPQPRGDEVLVAVRAAAINPSDVKNVSGVMHGTTLPRIPGRDFAGVVAKGPAELVGQEVWGTGGDIGFTRDGTHAEFILLPRSAVTKKPSVLSMDAAGSAGLTFVTAWAALVTAGQVSSGETAAIIGAAGGVGSAAVQIAKARGARVIGVVRSDIDIATARRNGADEAINARGGDVVAAIRAATNDRGANVVFDTSGMMFGEAVEMAALEGRIAVIAAPPDGTSALNLRTLYRKELRIEGVDTRRLDAVACARLLEAMATGFESGQFMVNPGEARPLSQVAKAYEDAGHGGVRIILRPGD